jgi:hypothetical protein
LPAGIPVIGGRFYTVFKIGHALSGFPFNFVPEQMN